MRNKTSEAGPCVDPGLFNLLDQTPGMMYLAEPVASRKLVALSPALAKALGYRSRGQALSQDLWAKHLHPDDRDGVFEHWAKPEEATGSPLVYRLQDCQGRIRWIHEESTVLRGAEGEPGIVHAVLIEISESKRVQERLESYARDLGERVKELDCLYAITHLSEGGSVDELLARVAQVVPRAWQYPERAHCRIVYGNRSYASDSEPLEQPLQTADIVIHGAAVGRVEIGYKSEDGQPAPAFLEEEWSLIRGVARRLADVLQRRQAEEALRRSEELYRILARNIPRTLVGLYDENLRCTLAEGSLKGRFTKRRIEGHDLSEVWNGEAAFLAETCRGALEGQAMSAERRCGAMVLSVHAVPLTEREGVKGGMFVLRDVTERRNLEKEVLDIATAEQRRLGQDLHDGLGQILTGLMCLSGGLARNLQSIAPDCAAQAEEMTQVVRQAMTEVRSLSRGLVPVQLDRHGLANALQELAYDCENLLHTACQCVCHAEVAPEDAAAATQLYRIAQEAVNNAVRHGQAKNIRILLDQEGGRGRLRIEDDGRGFSVRAAKGAGMGLSIMRYRAEMLGGTLEIDSRRGRGTRVECRFPLGTACGGKGKRR